MSVKASRDLRTLYDGEQVVFSNLTAIDCGVDPDTGEELVSMTKQSSADECDINHIMARYETTGTIDHVNRSAPQFGDFLGMVDYQSALNMINDADEQFMLLSAKVRARFDNDPAELLRYLNDPKNRDEAIELGLIDRPADPPPPVEVRVVPDPEASTTPPKPV